MATIAGEAPYEERSLFVRKATGLVRGWSVHDAFIYATFSINLITLGLYIFSFGPFIPKGSLLLAVILSGAYLVFQTIVYAALIAVMPRAGGDYVWVSRVIGGGLGLLIVFGLLIFHSKDAFITAFNHHAQSTYNATTPDAYAQTLKKGGYAGAGSLGGLAFGSTVLLIPMIAFFNLWSNWGATLYGEGRGASDFRTNITAMAAAMAATAIGAVIFILLTAHTIGLTFYNS